MDFKEVLARLDERGPAPAGSEEAKEVARKAKENPREVMSNPRKYKVGDRVIGQRSGSKSDGVEGELVKIEVTLNNGYRNPSYTIETDDGKRLKFQGIKLVKSSK